MSLTCWGHLDELRLLWESLEGIAGDPAGGSVRVSTPLPRCVPAVQRAHPAKALPRPTERILEAAEDVLHRLQASEVSESLAGEALRRLQSSFLPQCRSASSSIFVRRV